VTVSEEPKKHFYSTPDLKSMTPAERTAWISNLHKRMVADLRGDEPEPIEEEPTEEPEAKA
jgi:hypothetical protein